MNNKEEFINYINNIYKQNLDNINTIQSIINYHKNNKINIDWLDDNNIIFNISRRSDIIDSIKQLIKNNFYNYDEYVKLSKKFIFSFIKNYKPIKDTLLNYQIKYIISNMPLHLLEIEKICDLKDFERLQKEEGKIKYKDYNSMTITKGFNSVFIFYSYICYFKCAINCIIHHPMFKYFFNINTDSLKGGNMNKLINKKYYSLYDFYQIGGNELWNKLNDNNIIEIIEFYNILTNHKYLIGTPGIKYYPHQILQELLFFINNDFSQYLYCNYQYVKVIDYLYDNIDMNDKIIELLNDCQNNSLFIAPIIDNPLDSYEINIIKNNHLNYQKDLLNRTNNKLNNTKIYHYNYIINDYYLQSFCIIENIPNKYLTFHCVYIQLIYDDNYNVIDKIRYDHIKARYNNFNMRKYKYMKIEYDNLFNDNGINDYYDGNNNYKICLLCYIKK